MHVIHFHNYVESEDNIKKNNFDWKLFVQFLSLKVIHSTKPQ